jgi:hypothetical protein
VCVYAPFIFPPHFPLPAASADAAPSGAATAPALAAAAAAPCGAAAAAAPAAPAAPPCVPTSGAARVTSLLDHLTTTVLDRGDVMFDGSCVWCGVSARSNAEAAAALAEALAHAGIPVAPITVTEPNGATLHLKSIVSALASHHILVADSAAADA